MINFIFEKAEWDYGLVTYTLEIAALLIGNKSINLYHVLDLIKRHFSKT